MPLDDTNFDGRNEGDGPKWNRICSRMDSMLRKLERYGNKVNNMCLDDSKSEIKKSISLIGAGIAEARILAEESGMDYFNKIAQALAEAKMNKDGVYVRLLNGRNPFAEGVRDEVYNHPLAVKARALYEGGESMIIKSLVGKK